LKKSRQNAIIAIFRAIISTMLEGCIHIPPIAHHYYDQEPQKSASDPNFLHERKAQVVQLSTQGMTYAQIGDALHIASKTVENHMTLAHGILGTHDRLQTAIEGIQRGNLSPVITDEQIQLIDTLTPRQQEVLETMLANNSAYTTNRQIAILLGHISIKTVEKHVTDACKKLGVHHKHQAALIYGIAKGLISIPNDPQPEPISTTPIQR
jgi:DNA-binding NarL/FixJ family response regulator